jgi:hypothetical protein
MSRLPRVRKRVWKWVVRFALALGLLSDFYNVIPRCRFWLRKESNRPIVFEDFSPTGFPECAFSGPFLREEAEPAWYWNLFDVFPAGLGSAEESASAKAEYKIWRNLASRGSGSSDMQMLSDGSVKETGRIHKELVEEDGLQYVRKKFYFDEYGYHASLVMGRLRRDLVKTLELGCETQADLGQTRTLTYSKKFTCESLEQVIERETKRASSSDHGNNDRCIVSFRYETNFQTGKVTFHEEYFVRDREEDVNADRPAM